MFLWQVILFLYKRVWNPSPQNVVSIEQFPCLELQACLFQKIHCPKEHLLCYFPPHRESTLSFSPKFTHLFVLFCKLSQYPKNDSVDLWLVTAHTLCNAFNFFRSPLPPPDVDDSATILRRISGDTSPDSHLWTWRIMIHLSAATQNQWLFLNIHI